MTGNNKHVALRSCAVCRTKRDKRTLTRLVKTDDGIMIDPTGKRDGRGAYLCDDPQCWHKAASTSILNAAFKTQLTAVDRDHLRQHIS